MNQTKPTIFLGIDIGASGIKGALVNTETGELTSDRLRVETPQGATPIDVALAVKQLSEQFYYSGAIGVGFPAIVKRNVAYSAANISPEWVGVNIADILGEATKSKVVAANDADLAGLAEMQFGKGKNQSGTVVMITLGTGIGTALFCDGRLVPNTEFGHLRMPDGMIAEKYAADSIRKKEGLSVSEWGKRINRYLEHLELYLQPDLILLGGGGSKKFDLFRDRIKIKTEVQPAQLLNQAGIIGAAVLAADC